MVLVNDIIEKRIKSEEISDDELKRLAYALEYFEFYGSAEDLDYWNEIRQVLISRLKCLQQKKTITNRPIAKSINSLTVQLWENCKCGQQPIYMSHGCCEKCSLIEVKS